MAQFTSRPEEPTEWAGLPSEPLASRSDVESLAEPGDSADSLGIFSTAVASVAIPVPPAEVSPPDPGSTDEGGAEETHD